EPDLASAGCDNPWAIRPDQPRFFAVHERFDPHHVHHRYSFRDANDQLNAGIDSFENGIGGGRGARKTHSGLASRFPTGLPHRVQSRHLAIAYLTTTSRRPPHEP